MTPIAKSWILVIASAQTLSCSAIVREAVNGSRPSVEERRQEAVARAVETTTHELDGLAQPNFKTTFSRDLIERTLLLAIHEYQEPSETPPGGSLPEAPVPAIEQVKLGATTLDFGKQQVEIQTDYSFVYTEEKIRVDGIVELYLVPRIVFEDAEQAAVLRLDIIASRIEVCDLDLSESRFSGFKGVFQRSAVVGVVNVGLKIFIDHINESIERRMKGIPLVVWPAVNKELLEKEAAESLPTDFEIKVPPNLKIEAFVQQAAAIVSPRGIEVIGAASARREPKRTLETEILNSTYETNFETAFARLEQRFGKPTSTPTASGTG